MKRAEGAERISPWTPTDGCDGNGGLPRRAIRCGKPSSAWHYQDKHAVDVPDGREGGAVRIAIRSNLGVVGKRVVLASIVAVFCIAPSPAGFGGSGFRAKLEMRITGLEDAMTGQKPKEQMRKGKDIQPTTAQGPPPRITPATANPALRSPKESKEG